jgi:hypothetical protein
MFDIVTLFLLARVILRFNYIVLGACVGIVRVLYESHMLEIFIS